MDFWDAVVLIVLIVAVAWLRSAKYRAGAAPIQQRLAGSREGELEHEIAELRKRIAVLERIATDERKSREIAAEIEALRDSGR